MGGAIAITGGGAFTAKNIANINSNFSQLFAGFTPGNLIYLWPSFGVAPSGFPQAPDGSINAPYTDLASAYGAGRANKNDIIILVGNGASTGSVRLSANFAWAKSGLHMIGISEPGMFSQRARIAPTAGVTGFANFFTITASGCFFQNIEWFQGFTAGIASEICLTLTGASNNTFQNCHIAGMADTDAGSGATAGARNLKISGGGENYFNHCVIGVDTIARSTTNASLELAGATTRNVFEECIFPSDATNSGALTILGTGADCIDRFTLFNHCSFINAIKSGGTGQTVLASLTNAAPGGMLVFKDCISIGSTKFGDTNALANSYIDMAAVSASAGGLGVNPS